MGFLVQETAQRAEEILRALRGGTLHPTSQ
jgi:hypothetical protein